MKKIILLGAMLTAALSLTNCTKEAAPSVPETKVPYTIYANAPESRTTNDGLKTLWEANDQINVFHAKAGTTAYDDNTQFTLAAGERGEFSTENLAGSLAESNDWYVIYPYNAAVTSPASATLTIGAAKDAAQTQNGNDSKEHIAGENLPLWGKQAAVAKEEAVSIAMDNVASLVEVTVLNTLETPLTVTSVSFTAPEAVVGAFTADITGETPVLTAVEGSVSNTALLNVTGATELAQNAQAKFYLAVKPFTAKAGQDLTLSVNGFETTVTLEKDKVFAAGNVVKLGIKYAPKVSVSLYDKYMAGEDIVIAGVAYNKATYGDATLLKADNANFDFKSKIHQKKGVFFLESSGDGKFITTSVTEIKDKIVLIGNNATGYVNIAPTMNWKLIAGELVMKNILFDMISLDSDKSNDKKNNDYAFNNANATADFEKLHFDNCRFDNVQKPIFYIPKDVLYMVKSIRFIDGTIQVIGSGANTILFNLYKTTCLDACHELAFTNNILYSQTPLAVQIFSYDQAIAQPGTTWEGSLSVTQNTLYNVPGKNGYVKFYQLANIDFSNNIFYIDETYSTSSSYMIILYSANQTGDNCKFENNVVFGMASGKNWDIAHSNSTYKPTTNRLTKLTESPFETAEPATGTFIPKSEYAHLGAQR